jgi:hypothetical protein
MTTFAVALLLAFVPQDEARLKESWPKLVDAWKAVDAYKPSAEAGPIDDEFLKVAAKLHASFDAAGLYAADGEYLPQAMKAFLKARARSLMPAVSNPWGNRMVFRRVRVAGGGGGAFLEAGTPEGDPLNALLASLKKLQDLKAGGLDDEENVQDELSTARKSLKALGITADDTPAGLRKRALHLVKALALGEEYPAPAVATEEQAKQIRAWIGELGHESIETRENAMRELMKAGDAALPFARDMVKSTDAEVASRARTLLGYGHAPWTKLAAQDGALQMDFGLVVPAAPAAPPAPAPKEEKPK